MSEVTLVLVEEEILLTVTEEPSIALEISDPEVIAVEIAVGQRGPQGEQGIQGIQGVQGLTGDDGLGVPAGGTTGQILAKVSDDDNDSAWTSYSANSLAKMDGDGNLASVPQISIDEDGYTNASHTALLDGNASGFDVYRNNLSLSPESSSPDETWHLFQNQVSVDPDSTGFDIGVTGTAFRFHINNINHNGASDLGALEFIQNNFYIGNGTDPIEFRGLGYMFGFGQINDNVTLIGPMQGYGFQFNIADGAVMNSNAYVQGFYDNVNIACASRSYTSFNAGPNIASFQANNGYTGLNVSPTIDSFPASTGFTGIAVGGNLGTFENGSYFNGVNVNPNIDSCHYAAGISVSMDNVTVYPGVAASLVIQDLTIATDLPSSQGNDASIAFVDDGTAGAETVSQASLAFTVHMEAGVSTAAQIASALNSVLGFTSNFNVTISGVGSNPQAAQAATNLSGGEDPGRKQAAWLDGDVEITGDLTFGGALSIGRLNAFASMDIISGTGNPNSVHGLISRPVIEENESVTLADLIGINTAMLLTMGDNSHVTTALVGISALALPAVVSMGTGSTVDRVAGATFAVSLDSTATGGTIGELDLCRSVAIPNGVTTIDRLNGFIFDLPFGDPGSVTFGFYESPGVNNYLAGNLLVGGTAFSDDLVENDSVGLELRSTTKAMLSSRMTETQRDALTAVNGMVIYNSTSDKLQARAGGAWVDLH